MFPATHNALTYLRVCAFCRDVTQRDSVRPEVQVWTRRFAFGRTNCALLFYEMLTVTLLVVPRFGVNTILYLVLRPIKAIDIVPHTLCVIHVLLLFEKKKKQKTVDHIHEIIQKPAELCS